MTAISVDKQQPQDMCPEYPLQDIDRIRLNQIIRHRVRNLCGGTRMILDVLRSRVSESSAGNIDWSSLYGEVDNMQVFSRRLDLLIEPLLPPQAASLGEVFQGATQAFAEEFPFCTISVSGGDAALEVREGNWYRILLDELLNNAGRAAGSSGTVDVAWTASPRITMVIANSGKPFPGNIPLAPPVPFETAAASRDGLGLAIVHRLCLALGLALTVRTDLQDMTAVAVGPAE